MPKILTDALRAIKDDPVSGAMLDIGREIPAGIGRAVRDFVMQPGDIDRYARENLGYEGGTIPLGVEMIPYAETAGDLAFTANSLADQWNEPSMGNAAKTGLGMAATLLPFVGMGGMIKAFHGTPHDLYDPVLKKPVWKGKYKGQGEGAHAYGDPLTGGYFAEAEETGKIYQNNIPVHPDDVKFVRGETGKTELINLKDKYYAEGDVGHATALEFLIDTGDPEEVYRMIDNSIKPSYQDEFKLAVDDIVEKYSSEIIPPDKGNLYNVNLNVEPEDLLDWDAPLSEQPEKVREALESSFGKAPTPFESRYIDSTGTLMGDDPTGREIMEALRREKNFDDIGVSAQLKEAGIPGIKYLDGNSRSAGEGTRNFVIFDEDLIEIADDAATQAADLKQKLAGEMGEGGIDYDFPITHGSNDPNLDIKKAEGSEIFDGVFASAGETSEQGGKYQHTFYPRKGAVMRTGDIDIDPTKAEKWIRDTHYEKNLNNDDMELLYKAVMKDDFNAHEIDSKTLKRLFYTEDAGEASWQAQNWRGKFAGDAGFDAAAMSDEFGTSYFIPYNSKAIKK